MAKMQFTTEQLADRWADYREIENLMSRRSFLETYKRSDKIFEDYWCRKAADPCYGLNNGYYKGYEAIAAYYDAQYKLTKLRTKLLQDAYPEKLGGRGMDEIFGAGSLVVPNTTTPIIEIAGDGKTAKGLWYIFGSETEVTPEGPVSTWVMGRLGVDFVREDGKWKIWHFLFIQDIDAEVGTDWSEAKEQKPVNSKYAALLDYKMPEPNVPKKLNEIYHGKRKLVPIPAIPEPYMTFAETFSYGI